MCTHNRSTREQLVEEWLLANLADAANRSKVEWEMSAAQKRRVNSSNKKAALKNKLTKLKELYVNDLIDLEEYKKDFEIYTAALNQIPEQTQIPAPNFAAVEKLLQSDFRALYDNMSREEKRTLWRSIIKEIRIDNDMNITGIIFA